jgi:hypothetical protein
MRKTAMIIGVLTAIVFGQGIPATGLVAWFPFTGNSNDSSGFGNNLMQSIPVRSPKPTTDRFSAANAADSFDGSGNWFFGSAKQLPAGDSDRTISVWIKPTSNIYTIMTYGDTLPGKKCELYVNIEGSRSVIHITNGLHELKDTIATSRSTTRTWIDPTLWNHIAVSISKNETRLYVNNMLAVSGRLDGWATTKDTLCVGGCSTKNSSNVIYGIKRPFGGGLDDIAIYNRVLTPTQIKKLFVARTEINKKPVFTSTPLAYAVTNRPYRYTVLATDANTGDAGALSISLATAPTTMELNANAIYWLPTQKGTYPVTIAVTDSSDTTYQSYTITVDDLVSVVKPIIHNNYKTVNTTAIFDVRGKKMAGNSAGIFVAANKKIVASK